MVRPVLTIDMTGPFFAKDPGKTIRGNIRDMLEGVAEEGERLVKSQFPTLTGAGREGVVGRVASFSGKPWMLTAKVSQTHTYPWPGGGAAQYRGGRLERKLGMFKRTARAVRVARTDLVKGLE